jgi:hypothetical protein
MQKINPPWELHLGIRKVLPAKLNALRWNLAGLKPESVLHGQGSRLRVILGSTP